MIIIAISPQTDQYLNQISTLRYIDASTGPDGPQGVVSYWLVPANGYNNYTGERFPHNVAEDLANQDHKKTTLDGVEYYLVPEVSTNTPGRLSHYAQLTGEADLQNPPGGGVNRARETFIDNSASATVHPEGVRKYVDEVDSWEEARKKKTEEEERVVRQVNASPAREPAEGKLVHTEGDEGQSNDKPKAAPVPKATPKSE